MSGGERGRLASADGLEDEAEDEEGTAHRQGQAALWHTTASREEQSMVDYYHQGSDESVVHRGGRKGTVGV